MPTKLFVQIIIKSYYLQIVKSNLDLMAQKLYFSDAKACEEHFRDLK